MNNLKSCATKVLCTSVLAIRVNEGRADFSLLSSPIMEKPMYSIFLPVLFLTQSIAGTRSASELTTIAASYLLSIAPTIKSVANFTSIPFSLNLSYCILSIPFLYLNYKIIKNDVKEKKIPNKYL